MIALKAIRYVFGLLACGYGMWVVGVGFGGTAQEQQVRNAAAAAEEMRAERQQLDRQHEYERQQYQERYGRPDRDFGRPDSDWGKPGAN
jgi:hypothetical protein